MLSDLLITRETKMVSSLIKVIKNSSLKISSGTYRDWEGKFQMSELPETKSTSKHNHSYCISVYLIFVIMIQV